MAFSEANRQQKRGGGKLVLQGTAHASQNIQ